MAGRDERRLPLLSHLPAEEGHDAVHLRDEGLHRLPDEAIFDKAIAEARIILTFDLDFGEIAARAKGRATSVVLFRLPDASLVLPRPHRADGPGGSRQRMFARRCKRAGRCKRLLVGKHDGRNECRPGEKSALNRGGEPPIARRPTRRCS